MICPVKVSSSSIVPSNMSLSATLPVMFKAITWNIEGAKQNQFSLKYFMDRESPDFIFLNECLLFQYEVSEATNLLQGEYCHALCSEDILDPELPFVKNKSNGGTMILWKNNLDNFVTVLTTETPSFQAILFHHPDLEPSLHISLYLPTSGKETEYIEEITKLRDFIDDTLEQHPGSTVFIRGDSNANINNKSRHNIFRDFQDSFNLVCIPVGHKTYHHFLGDGQFDSEIDVIMHGVNRDIHEEVTTIYCQDNYPNINSHHDLIVSVFSLPSCQPRRVTAPLPIVPSIQNTRQKTKWTTEGIPAYQSLVGLSLTNLRERWAVSSSRSCISLLVQVTSEILCSASSSSNTSISLSNKYSPKSARTPKNVKSAVNKARRRVKFLKQLSPGAADYQAAKTRIKEAISNLRKVIHMHNGAKDVAEDKKMFSIISSSSSSSIYEKIKSLKSSSVKQIPFLNVGSDIYWGEDVKAGFYDSISKLKTRPITPDVEVKDEEPAIDYTKDYHYILQLCRYKQDLPAISLDASTKILKNMKPTVNDFFSITSEHYLNAGKEGIEHFNFLMNIVIEDVNNATVEELNACYALLLFKGHGKSRTSDTAYRTISTCPILAKALDLYIRDLHQEKWKACQAPTQYQGQGSSHDLAALLVTEVIQHSLFTLKEPAYLLFLDAKSAFDRVLPELLIRNLYSAGMDGCSTIFVNNRLISRHTYLDWDKNLMGPIEDQLGLEQGGSNSSEYYKMYSNENLTSAQRSEQGIDLGNSQVISADLGNSQVISAVGLADDTALTANRLSSLANILFLVKNYCSKYGVKLSADKTKLLCISNKSIKNNLEEYNPITIDNKEIDFSEKAEHVGIIRSNRDGNMPHLLNRICCHRKALQPLLSSGVAYKRRANPLVGLRLQCIYGTPVLLSGVASLVLTRSEISLLDKHLKVTYQNIQKLHQNTPRSVVYFLGGCLPGEAVIHLQFLSLFGMVSRLPRSDPLRIHAEQTLTVRKSSSKSWFWLIRDICLLYGLPHPCLILEYPQNKKVYKKQVKSRVVNYWEQRLRGESSLLQSLEYFHPEFMSLTKPHPIWTTPGSNPYEIAKAVQQARFLSGRYRSANLTKHWAGDKDGLCLAPSCVNKSETIEHILVHCDYYFNCKRRLYSLWLSTTNKIVLKLVLEALSSESQYLVQFVLDCTVLPSVIKATQTHGSDILKELFYLTRSWCFSLHRQRMKLLGRWNFM